MTCQVILDPAKDVTTYPLSNKELFVRQAALTIRTDNELKLGHCLL